MQADDIINSLPTETEIDEAIEKKQEELRKLKALKRLIKSDNKKNK